MTSWPKKEENAMTEMKDLRMVKFYVVEDYLSSC